VADTTALMSDFDLIIAVDTMTAHLADALGRPVLCFARNCGRLGCTVGIRRAPFEDDAPADHQWRLNLQRHILEAFGVNADA
jgi:hypothetical protein